METIDLKTHRSYVQQYLDLRNALRDLLLTRQLTLEETIPWLDTTDTEIRCLVDDHIVVGVVMLYLEKNGEVSLFTKYPRKGLGSELLCIIEQVARERKIEKIWSWVLATNQAALGAIQKNGKTREAITTKRFGSREFTGVIFTKTILNEVKCYA